MNIRRETLGDAPAIRKIHERAFGGTYESGVVEGLRLADRVTLSLIAENDDRVVGHAIFSPIKFEHYPNESRWAALGPIGVLPENQGVGIGSQLVVRGVEGCRDVEINGVVLLGAPMYYSRFGFVRASDHGLTSEFGDGPAFQAIELRPGAFTNIGGKVIYAPEFDEE